MLKLEYPSLFSDSIPFELIISYPSMLCINVVCLLFFLQVDTFASVYKKLTGRDVTFEFPENYL